MRKDQMRQQMLLVLYCLVLDTKRLVESQKGIRK